MQPLRRDERREKHEEASAERSTDLKAAAADEHRLEESREGRHLERLGGSEARRVIVQG